MGSGSRFKIITSYDNFAVGVNIGRFPHSLGITFSLGFWDIYIGFGKGYDE